MLNNRSLIDLINELEAIADAHPQVETVKTGVLDKLALTNYDYPLVNISLADNHAVNLPETTFNVMFSCFKLLDKQLNDEMIVTSDCYDIILAILEYLHENEDLDYLRVDFNNLSFEQALSKTEDMLGGIQCTVPITIYTYENGCKLIKDNL